MKLKNLLLVGLLICAMAASFFAGWVVRGRQANREAMTLALVQDLERLSFATNALALLDNGAGDRQRQLLWLALESSVDSALSHIDAGGRLDANRPLPALYKTVERARLRALHANSQSLVEHLDSIKAQMPSGQ